LDVLVRESAGADEEPLVTGFSLLATHTTVRSETPLYHMPRYILAGVELEGEKKPKAKLPPSETMMAPGRSGLPGTSRSSDAHSGRETRIRTAV
jgi:hypothetical protein